MLTGRQIREGRALLGLHRSKFALKVGTVTTLTIVRAEAVDDEPPITDAQAAAIARAFDRAGVEFGPFGVRLPSWCWLTRLSPHRAANWRGMSV